MTFEKDNVITKETNKTIRCNALRIFICGLNGSISETRFSLNPPDLPKRYIEQIKTGQNMDQKD